MSDIRYNWKRFWCRRDGSQSLGDGGYLSDPDSEYGIFTNRDVKDYSSIRDTPCLALLGEPGIGKSYAIKEAVAAARSDGSPFIHVNLREFGSEDRLVSRIFESDTYREWLGNESTLELLLDSLDECLLRIGTIIPILESRLQGAPIARLRLRIACRTAEWPPSLERILVGCWGDDSFKAYELCPLRRQDVQNAAETEDMDAGHFMEEVSRVRSQPLAIKPVTLRFLLKTYQNAGALPESESELYSQGCQLLCEESQERVDSRTPFAYSGAQRLAVAKRIAAVTVFANKYAVWTARNEGDVPDEDVLLARLAGGTESADGTVFDVTPEAVSEALDTGLFSSRGANRMGWAHQTYAEFLAASYLHDRRVTGRQMLSLVTDDLAGETKVIPQLSEVAARLATDVPEVFDELLVNDPVILLRSDVATADAARRSRLVGALLGLCQGGDLHIRFVDIYSRLRCLKHDNLGDQLRPTLADHGANIHARLLAVEIAHACVVTGLTDELSGIIFDRSTNIELRVMAIDCLNEAGDEVAKARLVELIAESPEDPDNRVAGAALEVLWPNLITAKQVFDVITSGREITQINRFAMFISHRLPEQLQPGHLTEALRWVIQQNWSRFNSEISYRNLLDGIIVSAWHAMDTPGVLPLLATAICRRLQVDHGHLLDSKADVDDLIGTDNTKRRRLLAELVPLLGDSTRDAYSICDGRASLVRPEDMPWLLEQLTNADGEHIVRKWAEVCNRCYSIYNSGHTNLILERGSENALLRETFSWLFAVVDLDSPEAQTRRDEYNRYRNLSVEEKEEQRLDPPPPERIQHWLNQSETDTPSIWWHLSRELTLTIDNPRYGDVDNPDITTFSGWKDADESTRDRVVEAARRYILNCDDRRSEWLTTPNTFSHPANAGYQALRLLLTHDPCFIDGLQPDVWGSWAAALIQYPLNLSREEQDLYSTLLRRAYQQSPESITEAVIAVLHREASETPYLSGLHRVRFILDQRMIARLRLLADDGAFRKECRGQVLAFLIEKRDQETIARAMQMAEQPLPSEDDDQNIIITALSALGEVIDSDQWDRLWLAVQEQPLLGRTLISRWAQSRDTAVLTQLADKQLADLYVWVSGQYPHSEDSHPRGVHTVTSRENIAYWRDQHLLQTLVKRGTLSACVALATVKAALPDQEWLSYTLQEAVIAARTKNWRPLEPNQVLELVRNSNNRLVASGKQLLNVVMESLARLQVELRGEQPAIRDIWDYNRKDKLWRPLDENSLSDYIARFLRKDISDRRLVINREVQIRPRLGVEPGQATDIHVVAVIEGQGNVSDVISVIVEVKGCWHAELETAMETQLVGRYLKDNQCRCGLYLIGWFACDSWDDGDHRKTATPVTAIDAARTMFEEQAISLSRDGLTIRSHVLDTRLDSASILSDATSEDD